MLVTKARYDTEVRARLAAEMRLIKLLVKWNALVDKLNAKGGEEFLDSKPGFEDKEIAKLLQLCHPDKHGGKQLAIDMTKLLLARRK